MSLKCPKTVIVLYVMKNFIKIDKKSKTHSIVYRKVMKKKAQYSTVCQKK